jgi:large subunit ribosomal protein L25
MAAKRVETGSHKARHLRKEGKIPGVIYGHGKETVAVTLNEHEIELAVSHGERLLEIELEGQSENVLIKEVQYDAFGSEILHVDLNRVDLDERVEVTVALVLVGEPEGVKEGGVLQQSLGEITVECPVRHIPEEIKHLVTGMKLNDRLYLRDLALPEGAVLVDEPDSMVASVIELAEEEEAPVEGEEAAEPEVIGAKPAEEEEAEEKSE